MKLSDVKSQIESLMEKEGNLDLGEPQEVSFRYRWEGWVSGWSAQVVSTGLSWGDHFIGTESIRTRTKGDPYYRPTDDEMSEPEVREVRR